MYPMLELSTKTVVVVVAAAAAATAAARTKTCLCLNAGLTADYPRRYQLTWRQAWVQGAAWVCIPISVTSSTGRLQEE